MTKIDLQNALPRDTFFNELKADFAGRYKVYHWGAFGLKAKKVIMVQKSWAVATMITMHPKENKIQVAGFFPNPYVLVLFSGILGYFIGYLIFGEKWNAFEDEVAGHISKKYNGTSVKKIVKKSTLVFHTFLVLLVAGLLLWAAASIDVPENKEQSLSANIIVVRNDDQGRPVAQFRLSDRNCSKSMEDVDSLHNVHYETISYETIREGMPIEIVTSCTKETFTISGSVSQTISYRHENPFLNLENMGVNDDYNFDGYNDFAVWRITEGGGGDDPNTTYTADAYLYDPTQKQFVFNSELSALKNMIADPVHKYVQEDLSYYTDAGEHIDGMYQNYKWVNGHLVKVEE